MRFGILPGIGEIFADRHVGPCLNASTRSPSAARLVMAPGTPKTITGRTPECSCGAQFF